MSELVRDYLNYYLHQETTPRFAVMLKGKWGAGKTYFVRSYLREFAKQRKAFDPLYHSGYYYVSLFGKTSRADIAAALFNAAHPVLGSGVPRVLGTLVSRAANTAAKGQAIKEGDAAALQVAMTNLDGRALIFDDLERCSMPMEELFGYINDFVEARKLKVVLIANEDQLLEKYDEDYKRQKEKVVGKTLAIRGEITDALNATLREIRDTATRSLVQTNRDTVVQIFEASDTNNFRSLEAALLDLEYLLKRSPQLAEKPLAAEKVLGVLLALTLEFRAGRIAVEDIGEIVGLRTSIARSFRATLTPKQEAAEVIQKRYRGVSWEDSIVSVTTLANLLDEGIIDTKALATTLSEHPLIVGIAESPPWRRLALWRNATQTEYAEARRRVLADLTGGTVTHPGPILHLAGIAISLDREGHPLVSSDPVTYFRQYIKDRLDEDTLISEPSLHERDGPLSDNWGGVMYDNSKSRQLLRIKRRMGAALAISLDRVTARLAPQILEAIKAGDYSYLQPGDDDSDPYRRCAMLHHFPISDVADLMLQDGRVNELLINAFNARHFRGYGASFPQEKRWLAALKTELLTRANGFTPPFKANIGRRVNYWFENIV